MIGFLSLPSKTARAIASNLPVTYFESSPPEPLAFCIRWGSTANSLCDDILNPAYAIRKASNKPMCRYLLEKEDIPIPEFTHQDFPVVGRKSKHRGGKGFYFCRNEEEVEKARRRGAVYFSKFYPKTKEYRIHVAGGRILLFSVKFGDVNTLVWNHREDQPGFRHMHRSEWLKDEKLFKMQKASKSALKALNLDFGAVDVMADAGEGYPDFVISEINTAPGLSDLAVDKYIAYFQKQINKRFPRFAQKRVISVPKLYTGGLTKIR